MGRPPGNGGPAFRFTPSEVSEMEAILQEHDNKLPPRDKFLTLAEKFSNGPDRSGKSTVQMKQVMNWFQNKRYALKAKSSKATQKLDITPFQAVPSLPPAHVSVLQPIPHVRQEVNGSPVSNVLRSLASHSVKALNNVEFEARSARDGAWYDVAAFLSVKNKDTDDPEVLVRFVGLTSEEDEWIKVSKHVRHRSLPCEVSECVAVLPGDLILCFQEATEQALYFDAHVLDAHRLKHDSRDCSCRFLVRYDHDQSEETVPLRKICRRPETDYRLQIYQILRDLPSQQNNKAESLPVKDKFDIIQQKMTPFQNSPDVLKKISTCALNEGNVENMTEESASKVSRKAEDILDQDVATKKGRIDSDGNVTTPEPQTVTITAVVTQIAKNEDVVVAQYPADITTITMVSSKEGTITTAVPEDPKLSSMARVDDPLDPSNNASASPGGAALTCQNQTNGHNPDGGASESSDVPVGPTQQCF